jgi:hypothetical protein
MRTSTLGNWLSRIALVAVGLGIVHRGDAHPGHREVNRSPAPEGEIDQGVSPSTTIFQPLSTYALGHCVWQAESAYTSYGGVFATCDDGFVPVTSAVYLENYDDPVHAGLVNLSPGVWEWDGTQNDGEFDGAGLSDDHAQIHGEPPIDGITTELFANTPSVSGSGIHYIDNGTYDDPNEIRTLCCESLDASANLDELEGCHYESAFVPIEPETDPDLPGQYVATLACSTGRITSGGCYTQFLHGSDWALTSSHPYVDGDPMQHPSGSHGSTTGETGWACRLDHEPVIDVPANNIEGIAVTALCCR